MFVRTWGFIKPEADSTDSGGFMAAEERATLWFLYHHAPCRVINRLDFRFWSLPTLDGNLLARILPQLKIPTRRVLLCAGTVDPRRLPVSPAPEAMAYRAFNELYPQVVIGSPPDMASLEPLLKVLPVRLESQAMAERLSMYVVGSDFFPTSGLFEAELTGKMGHLSVSICRELKLAFAKVRWMVGSSGDFYCHDIQTFPIFEPGDEFVLHQVANALSNYLLS